MRILYNMLLYILYLCAGVSMLILLKVAQLLIEDCIKSLRLKRKYDINFFKDKNVTSSYFAWYVKLPKDKDLFQVIYNKRINHTVFPRGDYTNYDFKDVNIEWCKFRKNTRLDNINMFQEICNKSLFSVILPKGDYSKFNFDGVLLCNTRFTKDSKLPMDINFFEKLDSISIIDGKKLPANIIKEIHLYNLNSVKIDLSECKLTKKQMLIIKTKFEEQCLNNRIMLPHARNLKYFK